MFVSIHRPDTLLWDSRKVPPLAAGPLMDRLRGQMIEAVVLGPWASCPLCLDRFLQLC